MALIGHWPLNGNKNDISGNGYIVTGSPTVVDGKIGQAYDFSTNRLSFLYRDYNLDFTKNISVSFWIYVTAYPASRMGIFETAYGAEFAINIDSVGGLQWYYGTSGVQDLPYTAFTTNAGTVEVGKWVHITLVRDIKNNALYCYKNGIKINTGTLAYIPAVSTTDLRIGYSYTGYLNGRLNDFRIYDEVLTDFEIQEIARAKILHYTFDDMQEPTTNISGGIQPTWGAWGTPVVTGSSSYTTLPNGKQAIYMTSTYSGSGGVHWRATNNGNLIPVSPSTAYTMSALIKYTNNNPSANLFYLRQYRANGTQIQENGWYSTTFRETLADGWYYAWRTVTLHAECVNVRLESYEYSTNEIWMYNFQFEKKDHPTEYTASSRTGQVKDYSGFFNHSDSLTETSTPTWTPDAKIGTGGYIFTPISNDSIFNENNAKIIDNTLVQLPYDQYTVSFWTYRTASGLQGGSYMRFGNYNAGVGFDTYDEIFNILAGQGAGVSLASVSLSTTLNQWEHTTLVFNRLSPNILKKYTNGVFVANGTQNLSYINNNNTPTGYPFRIGISFAGGVARSYNGIIDDVRIYATALSDKDIKDLYEARAEIEQSGVLYARDLLSSAEETVNLISTNFSNYNFDSSGFVTIGTRTMQSDGSVLIVNNNSNSRLSRFQIPILIDVDYTISVKIRKVSGADPLPFRWQLQGRNASQSVVTTFWTELTAIHEDNLGWQTLSYTFRFTNSTITNLYVWFQSGADYTGYTHSYYLTEPQLEQKSYATPFTSTYRPAIELPPTLDFAGNEVHETGTANFEDFSTVGITDGLVGYLPLDRNSLDYSGNNLNFTAYNTPLLINESHYFDGTSQYLGIPNNSLLTPGTSDFSILVSFLSPTLRNGEVFGKRTAGAGNIEMQLGSGGQIYTYIANLSGTTYANTSTYTAGVWQHYVLSRQGTSLKVYLNNVLTWDETISADFDISPTSAFEIARDPGNAAEYFQGYVKQFKYFNRALTAEEIAIEYNTMFKNEVQISKSGILYAKDLKQY